MNASPNHDPVNAIAEADATGRTAEIFAEIREVMQIPLVTSIWRTLDAIDGGLESVWAATRPIYQSGQPDAVLDQLRSQWELPIPRTPTPAQLGSAGLTSQDREAVLTFLEAYNRSNTLNLIALTALVRPSNGARYSLAKPAPPKPWPALRPLLEKKDISPANWTLLERTKLLGTRHPNSGLPTLWRHLIHWPGLIELVLENYQPLHQNGSLFRAIDRTTDFVEAKAPSLSEYRDTSVHIPPEASTMVENYVGPQPSVSRMATLGHSVSKWLRSCDWPKTL